VSYQILGLPNESIDSMVQTLAFNARLPVLLGASPFYRTPAAPIARGINLTEADYVKARLTALAIETDHFERDDIYTLFVTTRIINFLKGLPIVSDIDLTALIDQSVEDPRAVVGMALLKQLVQTGRLSFWTQRGLHENKHFDSALFFWVLSLAETITCQNGQRIDVRRSGSRLKQEAGCFEI
jgi:hypothetical protein